MFVDFLMNFFEVVLYFVDLYDNVLLFFIDFYVLVKMKIIVFRFRVVWYLNGIVECKK